jgi:tetratricopeptide (TPR) repeat protein
MKTSLPFSILSRFCTGISVAGLTLVSAVSVQGQGAQGAAASSAAAAKATVPVTGALTIGSGPNLAPPVVRIEPGNNNERKILADAKTLVKGNSLAAAEAKLTSLNVAKANTADWHMETNHRLMQLADSLARDGQRSTTKGLVTQSLQHLDEAEKLALAAKDVRGQAQAKAATGKIHERYLGDPVAAIAAYQAALKLTPTDKGIEEALDRLQRSYANAQAKVKAAKKR